MELGDLGSAGDGEAGSPSILVDNDAAGKGISLRLISL